MARTIAAVTTPQQRREQRSQAAGKLRLGLWRYFALASMLRNTAGLVASEGGAAGWWLTSLCLLPGLLVCGMLHTALRVTGCITVPVMARRLLGRGGMLAAQGIAALLLMIEGAYSLQALSTLFADGVGTTIGPAAFAFLAVGVLCLCTGRDGLLHGLGVLHWPLGAFAVLILLDAMQRVQWNHLFPMGGDGVQSWLDTLRIHGSMGWPMALLYFEPADASGRRGLWRAPAATVLCALLLCLSLPHGTLTIPRTLAEQLLLPGMTLHAANRVLLMCLWTAGLGLAASIAAARVADLLLPNGHRALGWLPVTLLLAWAAAHLAGVERMTALLGAVSPWMLAPMALLAVILLAAAVIRRKR